jgi:hypothetical protein
MEMRTRTVSAAVAIRTATPVDFPRVADAMASAFFDNPITIWHAPDETRRLDVMREFFTALLETVYTRFGLVYTNVGEVASGAMWIAHDAQEGRRPVPGLPLLECQTCNTPRAGGRVPRNMVVPPDTSAEMDRALAGASDTSRGPSSSSNSPTPITRGTPITTCSSSGCAPNARAQGSGRPSCEPCSKAATWKALPRTWRPTSGASFFT